MSGTGEDLHAMAHFIDRYGLHRGDQFAAQGPSAPLDICALAFIVAERCAPPREFYTDEDGALRLIQASAPAMLLIRALSDALDSEPCETEICPGYTVPDYVEHVSHWAATPAPGETAPPSISEVIGRIIRAAKQTAPAPVAA